MTVVSTGTGTSAVGGNRTKPGAASTAPGVPPVRRSKNSYYMSVCDPTDVAEVDELTGGCHCCAVVNEDGSTARGKSGKL